MPRSKRAESRARQFLLQQAATRGWKTRHPTKGGEVLEEQEIADFFPDSGLEQTRPDFMFVLGGDMAVVVETKNALEKLDQAIEEAVGYADAINDCGKYRVRIALGAAGEEDRGFGVAVRFLTKDGWVPLASRGHAVSATPSRKEVELALQADDGTTSVQVPSVAEFIDAAVELSRLLRLVRIEAPLRPKVIGALTLALYQGDLDIGDAGLSSINDNVRAALDSVPDLPKRKRKRLRDALKLQGGDYDRLSASIGRIVSILKALNIRPVLQTDTDFLGIFYEAFLRYGYDNNALGIVFTPRHITGFCADLVGVGPSDRVVDLASGTGGFLVAAFDRMLAQCKSDAQVDKVKSSLRGYDTNPTVWALSSLNMFFRGDGKTNITNASCFDGEVRRETRGSFTRAFLNPPFSQDEEPERDFIDRSMESLEPGGLLAVVVKAGIFADAPNQAWRREFVKKHTVLGLISLPEDLFYPTAAPTTILVARAHVPHADADRVFLGRVSNDGFEKLKGRRVEREGSELPATVASFHAFLDGAAMSAPNCAALDADILDGGAEWSPQNWLPQGEVPEADVARADAAARQALFVALTAHDGLAEASLADFGDDLGELPPLPYGATGPLDFFFGVVNGKSSGQKNYQEGATPYISSGDTTNSIVRLIGAVEDEVFADGALVVTAFGQASLQPWPFMARGNGGSSVRVLLPRYRMSVREMLWFVSQINLQRWRFFYARMAIRGRISKLEVVAPPGAMPDETRIHDEFVAFRASLDAAAARI